MILEFMLTVLIVTALSFLQVFFNGAYILQMYEPAVTFGVPLLSFICIFLFGKLKDYALLFCRKKKLEHADLSVLRNLNESLTVLFKIIVYTCFFFMILGIMYFYMNYGTLQAMGQNLAIVILSVKELLLYGLIIFTLKGNIRHKLILMMAEKNTIQRTEKPSIKVILKEGLKIAALIIFLVGCAWGISIICFIDESNLHIADFIDFFSLLFLCGGSIILLLVSGVYKGIGPVFNHAQNAEFDYTKKKLYQNAFQTLRSLVLMLGLLSSLIACMTTLNNLSDKKYLGVAMYGAMLTALYAVVINFGLLAMEAGVEKRSCNR